MSKVVSNSLWGLIIGPFRIPATEARVLPLRMLEFEKGKEVSPPSLAAAIGEGACRSLPKILEKTIKNIFTYKLINILFYKYIYIIIYNINYLIIKN